MCFCLVAILIAVIICRVTQISEQAAQQINQIDLEHLTDEETVNLAQYGNVIALEHLINKYKNFVRAKINSSSGLPERSVCTTTTSPKVRSDSSSNTGLFKET